MAAPLRRHARRLAAVRVAAIVMATLAGVVVASDARGAVDVTCKTPPGFDARGGASGDGTAVVFRTLPPAIAVGTHFTVEAIVCGGSTPPVLARVDAQMPEHRHGMNYRPTLAAKSPGHYVAEGFLFHMPGRWQFVFDLDASGRRTRLTTDVNVE